MVHNTNRINLKLYIQLKWIHAYTHTRLYILYIHTFVKAFVCKQLIGIHFIILVKYQFEMCHTGGDGSVSPLKNHIANEKLSREKKNFQDIFRSDMLLYIAYVVGAAQEEGCVAID